ncbi:MAG: pyridoxal-5'-phosphate-dependent protein subunit beta, partial [Anaerolineales bacterium]
MRRLGLEREIVDRRQYDHAVQRFKENRIALPAFSDLADPTRLRGRLQQQDGLDPDEPNPLNLFRVHWYNDTSRQGQVPLPEHLLLPKALTGVDARIVIVLGDRFPMIGAHKVLAAYGCLAPRIVTGQFDPTAHRA